MGVAVERSTRTPRRNRSIGWAGLGLACGALAGCGSSGNAPDAGERDAQADARVVHDARHDEDAPAVTAPCVTSATCGDGVCLPATGECCPSAADVCGNACCQGGATCFFGECVVPGGACVTQQDCPAGDYCAPGLGAGADAGRAIDGGSDAPAGSGADGATPGPVCTEPLPEAGRCLPLPPTCAGDAGAADAGACIAACEYHPTPGPLDAVTKWSWGPTATQFPGFTDVWSTPTVGRLYDSNCDGKIDEYDVPDIVFVSGNAKDSSGVGTCCSCGGVTPSTCHTGVLRMLDGRTGAEIWSLDKATSASLGFMGLSLAIGDIDGDGIMDIVAVTGEGYVVLVDGTGKVKRTSDKPIPGAAADAVFGWGGGLAIADLDQDGFPEIVYGATTFTTTNSAITLAWTGTGGQGGGADEELSTLVDLDGAADGKLEVLAGNTAYKADGTMLWHDDGSGGSPTLPDGFPGVGDFDGDGKPDVAVVANGSLWIVEGATGKLELGPFTLPGTGSGGPPTVADFDGDGKPEIGVAMATFYSVAKPNYATKTIDLLWKMPNHDFSSSVTGSTVFDFTGDGKPEVIYADECFLWVSDGPTGAVKFATSHTSFTATEASLVADVDGDGHAEMLMVSNGADPSSAGWSCLDASGNPEVVSGVTWVPGTTSDQGYRGITVFGDSADSWVGTRTLWNEHTYHVSNICDDHDTACAAPNLYGSLPTPERSNWSVPWLNDFRQNVQDKGVFDAPDAVVSLAVDCTTPVVAHLAVQNIGEAGLPAGVSVAIFAKRSPTDLQVGTVKTTFPLLPSQTDPLAVTLSSEAKTTDSFYAKIENDPLHPSFHECRTNNDVSATVSRSCFGAPK